MGRLEIGLKLSTFFYGETDVAITGSDAEYQKDECQPRFGFPSAIKIDADTKADEYGKCD